MSGYYSQHLNAERLRRCYDLAPARVQQYLAAEITHVQSRLRPTDRVLELGCGYGRALDQLAAHARELVGIDTSSESIAMANELLRSHPNCQALVMDAVKMTFPDAAFDLVACIQNGISAFHVEQRVLLVEAVRVTRPGGRALFSTYAERFWPHRLEWFRLQADAGLVGEIDWERTGNGVIVCRDGFTATTVTPDVFRSLAADLDAELELHEVDESSLFCELTRR